MQPGWQTVHLLPCALESNGPSGPLHPLQRNSVLRWPSSAARACILLCPPRPALPCRPGAAMCWLPPRLQLCVRLMRVCTFAASSQDDDEEEEEEESEDEGEAKPKRMPAAAQDAKEQPQECKQQ